MKNGTQEWDDMLLDFLDGNLDEAQRKYLEQSLEKDPSLKQRLIELRNVHDLMIELPLETPSRNFTLNVINNLSTQHARTSQSIRRSLMLFLGVVAVMSIAVVLVSVGVFDQTTTLDLNTMSVSQKFIKQSLPAISIDGKFLVNGIVLLNLIIAFLVLDRAILKPFFQRRMDNANLHS